MIGLQIQFGQLVDDAELVINLLPLLEGLPVQLNRLVRAKLRRQCRGQSEQEALLVRVDARRPPQRAQAVIVFAEAETKIGKKLVRFDVAWRRGDQLAAGCDGLFDATKLSLQP